MDSTAQLDGSDAQGNHVSTQSQRISAFKKQLGDVLLILDSLDYSSLDQLNQDEDCKDLVRRLLSIFPIVPISNVASQIGFPIVPFPNVASQIGQAVIAGLEGLAANITRLSQPLNPLASLSSPSPTLATPVAHDATISKGLTVIPSKSPLAGVADEQLAVPAQKQSTADIKDDPATVITIHFLDGGWRLTLPDTIAVIEGVLPQAGGHLKYAVRQSDQGSCPNEYLSLTSSPSTTSFPFMIFDIAPRISHLWTPGTITHFRRGGMVSYGFIISHLNIKAPFVEALALFGGQIDKDYLQVQPHRFKRPDIYVSATLGNGVYLLSGDVGRLEKLVSEGEKVLSPSVRTVNSQYIKKAHTNHHRVVVRPFCHRDREVVEL